MHPQKLDESIRQEIQLELRWMPGGGAGNVVVVVEAGVVTLTGRVADATIRRVGEQIARRVLGIRSVVNEIQIRRPEPDAEFDVSLIHEIDEAFGRGRQGND